MARYDGFRGYDRGRGGYDREVGQGSFAPPFHGPGGAGRPAGWRDYPGPGQNAGPGGQERWGGAERGAGVYGPARYGMGPYYQRLMSRRRPDDELQEEVEEVLFYDSWVDAEAITVAVEDGVVTLHGTLPSYEEIRYAIDDAWDVDGVRGVRSELSIREGAR
jgi:hypothetical protein